MLRCLLLYLVINDNFHCFLSIKVSQDYNQRKNEPPDHVIPYSEHENPPEPKYVPGNWVKPLENSGKKFEFIPQRSYSQVRRSSSVKHLPREEALARAETDQEREEAGRLKEVVTNRKVNTFYTEEGFEDAAYDHAGHIRDADFDESYENDNKNKQVKASETPSKEDSDEGDDEGRNSSERTKNGYNSWQESGGKSRLRNADKFRDYNNRRNRRKYDQIMYPRKHSSGENGISPRLIAENGIELLERDIERGGEEAAKGAETEVPENLRDLNDSSDYDEEEYEKSDEDYEDSDSDELKETPSSKTTAADQPVTAASLESYVGSIYTTVTPKYRGDLATIEPEYQIDTTKSSEYTTLEPKPEYKVLKRPRASRSDKTYGHYPTLSQIYETWKRRGIEQMYESNEELPAEHRADRKGSDRISADENSEEYEDNKVNPEKTTPKPKPTPKPRKAYLVMVRNLPKLNNTKNLNPKKKKFDYKYSKHTTRSAQPPVVSKQTYGNYTGLKPPPIRLLGQVTYDSFFSNSYNSSPSNPSVTQESGLQENAAKTSIPSLAPVPGYRYLRKYKHKQLPQLEKQSRYHRQSAKEMNNKLLSMTKILPPSPISRSEYAEYYNNHRRNGGTQPQHDPRPRVFKSHQSTLRFDGKTTVGKRPRYFVTNRKGDDEKVSVKDVKGFLNNRVNSNKLLIGREKRSDRVLLNSAPIFVDQVIDQELSKRFPEDDKVETEDGEKNSDEEEGSKLNDSSEEKSKNENEEKNDEVEVEVEVPEFNFTEVIDQNNGNDNKTNRGNVSEERREVNAKKYPFYNKIIHASALKYVINPHQVPKKTLGGLEFYDSRDRYMDCEDIEPNLSDAVPEREEPVSEAGPQTNLPRLRGLGDKLLCLKNKYFDKEPLDNPLFSEKQIESPKMPDELDPGLLKSKFESYTDYQDNSIRRMSNAPKIIDLRPIESRDLEDRKNNDKLSQPENSKWSNHAKRYRKRQRTASPTVSPYQREVYDDVMGTIKNLATMYRGIHVVSTSRPPASPKPNHRKNRFQSSKEKDQIRINSSSRDVIIPLNKQPRMRPHPKLLNYRTNKVSYRTRPMTKPFPGTGSGKVVGYFKTVRVHKRDLGYFTASEADLAASESQPDAENVDIAAGVFDSRRIKPSGQVSNAGISQAPEKIGGTLDNSKNSRSRGAVKFGKFPESGAETKRNEPRYTPVQKFDQVEPVKEENERNVEEIYKKDKELDDRYDVHEDVQENPVQNLTSPQDESEKEIYHPAANENEEIEDEEAGDDEETEEEYEGSSEKENVEADYDEEGEGGEEEEEEDGEEEREDEEYVRSSEESKSEEASEESEPHDDEEKNYAEVSDNEKEFERFSSRPFSSFESYYDPKYSDLGPRIDKPAFYHPSFDSLESRSRAKYDESQESEEKKSSRSRYTFPWHEDEEDASEESRKYEKIIKRHEFPWERRERIRRERARKRPKHGFEWSPSESVTHVQKIYPRERYSVPRKYGGLKKKKNFWPDKNHDYGYDSGYRPKYSNRYSSKFKFKDLIDKNPKNKTLQIDLSTTSTPQIPATSKEFITQIPPTTPLILTTTFAPVYTVSPRFRRPSPPKTDEGFKVDQVKSQSSPKKIKTTPDKRLFARRPASQVKNTSVPQKYLRRSRITLPPTSTPASISTSTSSRPTRKSTEDNTTPASRKVEHRSKVSKEEIITMSFPSMESIEIKADPSKNSSANRIVQKVSIVTKETPDHIYRTEETDKNGIKDTVISIIPNNRTGISFKSTDMSVDRVGVNQLNNSQDLDISLPPNKNLQLTEHGTRNIISSVSWISENYDY